MTNLTKQHGGLNFCKAFISRILLILELASSNLVQALLNPPQSTMALVILSGGFNVFANKEKGSCSIKSFPCNRNTIDEIQCWVGRKIL